MRRSQLLQRLVPLQELLLGPLYRRRNERFTRRLTRLSRLSRCLVRLGRRDGRRRRVCLVLRFEFIASLLQQLGKSRPVPRCVAG